MTAPMATASCLEHMAPAAPLDRPIIAAIAILFVLTIGDIVVIASGILVEAKPFVECLVRIPAHVQRVELLQPDQVEIVRDGEAGVGVVREASGEGVVLVCGEACGLGGREAFWADFCGAAADGDDLEENMGDRMGDGGGAEDFGRRRRETLEGVVGVAGGVVWRGGEEGARESLGQGAGRNESRCLRGESATRRLEDGQVFLGGGEGCALRLAVAG